MIYRDTFLIIFLRTKLSRCLCMSYHTCHPYITTPFTHKLSMICFKQLPLPMGSKLPRCLFVSRVCGSYIIMFTQKLLMHIFNKLFHRVKKLARCLYFSYHVYGAYITMFFPQNLPRLWFQTKNSLGKSCPDVCA